MKGIFILNIAIILIVGSGWLLNLIRLSECDMFVWTHTNSPYKEEVIRVVGIVPIVGMFTGWMDLDKEEAQ